MPSIPLQKYCQAEYLTPKRIAKKKSEDTGKIHSVSTDSLKQVEDVQYNNTEEYSIIYKYESTDDEQNRMSAIFEYLLQDILIKT